MNFSDGTPVSIGHTLCHSELKMFGFQISQFLILSVSSPVLKNQYNACINPSQIFYIGLVMHKSFAFPIGEAGNIPNTVSLSVFVIVF